MLKYRKTLLIIFGNLVALLIILSEVQAQNTEGYIYGKVTTFDNSYQGQIRWGKEEAFWNDMFNATKIKNEYYEQLRDQHEDKDKDVEWNIIWDLNSIWEDKLHFITHQFTCQFGDIKAITDIGRDEFRLVLKNGREIQLENGSNDQGSTINVVDDELGKVSIRWSRIEKIEFMPTPSNLKIPGGKPLYGTVETARKGTFIGFVQWDHDERLGEDILNGETRDGDLDIPFSQIEYIEKQGDRSFVRTNNGREFVLGGTNDVDSDNRGIIVTVPGVGKIDIPWEYFRNVSFEKPVHSGQSYKDYPTPRGLRGTVYTTSDETYRGELVYDLDESWEIETLDGNDDDVEYQIAFREIRSIIPKNYDYSMVELRNGDRILLGGSRDVSDSNDGILVLSDNRNSQMYIPWKKVAEVIFD